MPTPPLDLDDIFADTTPPRRRAAPADTGAISVDDLYNDSTPPKAPPVSATAPVVPAVTPAPRRGIVDAIGGWMSQKFQPPLETRHLEAAPEEFVPLPQQVSRARAQGRDLLRTAVTAEGSGAPAASSVLTRTGAVVSGAQADADATRRARQIQATEQANFSPEHWHEVARRGMELGSHLNAQGKHDEAQDVLRKAYNAQLLAQGAKEADTVGAIALSNALGIVHDPYQQQRTNIREAAQPGATFSPDEQMRLLDLRGASPERGSDLTKDIVAPLAGQLPAMLAGGALGRAAAGVVGAGLERAGAQTIGRMLGRVAGVGEEATGVLGPRVPTSLREVVTPEMAMLGEPGETYSTLVPRLREEVANLQQVLPSMAKRGATQGQIVGGLTQYRMAREQGASPEQALAAAVEGMGMSIPMGVISEVALGLTGKALGLGFDPIGRQIVSPARNFARDVFAGRPAPADLRGRFGPDRLAGDEVLGPERDRAQLLGQLGSQMEDVFAAKRGARQQELTDAFAQPSEAREPAGPEWWNAAVERGEVPRADVGEQPLGPEPREPGVIEPGSAYRTRQPEEPTPLRSAADVGMDRARALEPREEADASVQMQRANEAAERLRAQQEAEANDPNVRLEQAAQQRPGEQQGPRTLAETLEQAGRDAENGEPLASDYHAAINRYADALAAARDVGEGKEPSAKVQIALARARAGLDAARRKYGRQFGASAVLALAAQQSDLTDEEKKMVGLGGVAILSTAVVPAHLHAALRGIEAMEAGVHPGERLSPEYWASMLVDNQHIPAGDRARVQRTLASGAVSSRGLTVAEAKAALAASGPTHEPLYSRLRQAVENRESLGKKWDEPRPASDWIGKLTGSEASKFAKKELDFIMPLLKEAQANKTKISRADILQMIEDKVPRMERITLADANAGLAVPEPANVADVPEAIPLDELHDELPAATLREQIDVRRDRADSIEADAAETLERAERDMRDAEEEAERTQDRIYSAISDAGGDNYQADRALRYIREHVEPDDVSDHVLERAMMRLYEDIEIEEGEPSDILSDNGYTWEQVDEQPPELHRQVEVIHRGTSDHPQARRGPDLFDQQKFRQHLDDGRIRDLWGAGREHTTDDEFIAKAREIYGDDAEIRVIDNQDEIDAFQPDADNAEWVVRGSNGREVGRGTDLDDVLRDVAQDRGLLSGNRDELMEELDNLVREYAWDYARYMARESEHNYLDEGDGLDEQRGRIQELRDEADEIGVMHDHAANRENAALEAQAAARGLPEQTAEELPTEPPDAPAEEPEENIIPKVHGRSKFPDTQGIGGGSNYRELLNVWENKEGATYTNGHYAEYANTMSHLRVGDWVVKRSTADIDAFAVHQAGDPEAIRVEKAHIVEKRRQREKLLTEAAEIVGQYEALPEAEKDRNNPSAQARSYAHEIQQRYKQVVDIGKRIDELVDKVVNLKRALLGEEDTSEPMLVAVMMESQADPSQDANKYGIRQPVVPPDPARAAELAERKQATRAAADAAYTEWTGAATIHRSEASDRFANWLYHDKPEGQNENHRVQEYRQAAIEHNQRSRIATGEPSAEDTVTVWPPDARTIIDPVYAGEWAIIESLDPAAKPMFDEMRATFTEAKALERRYTELRDIADTAEIEHDAYVNPNPYDDPNKDKVDPSFSPFLDTALTTALNAARFLLDSAERGYRHIAWSSGANRVKNAHLPLVAAKTQYDIMTPAAIKRLLGALGFKDVKINPLYIKGEQHWHVELTPEMRRAIRRYGFPIMGALALIGGSSEDASAQTADGKPLAATGKAGLYTTAIGGIAAGMALAYLATHRKVRRLVKENHALSNALMLDDLSGLANKTAFSRARASVDADEKFHWVVFDGDRFKKLNDAHGHAEGDKAIQHFGRTVIQTAKDMDIPMRGFRFGGDEIAFAAPAEHAAEFLRRVEEGSVYERGDVTTKLTGGKGSTFEMADAELRAAKDAQKAADPSLRRTPLSNAVVPSERVYHGTMRSGLSSIEADPAERQYDIPTTAFGAFFSTRERDARWFGPHMYAADMPLKKPFEMPEAEFARYHNPGTGPDRAERVQALRAEVVARRRELEAQGYDGIVVRDATGRIAEMASFKNVNLGEHGGVQLYANPIGPALKQLARYPAAAALAGVGALIADQSTDEQWRKTGLAMLPLAALSAIGSRRLIAGKDLLADALLTQLRRTGEGTTVARFFNPDALLSDDVRSAISRYESDRSRARAKAAEFAQRGRALGPSGDRAVSDVIENEQWEDTSQMSPQDMTAVLTFASALDSEYQKAAQEQLATGARQPDELLPNYAGPRRYAYHEAQAAQAEGGPGATTGGSPRIKGTKHRTLDEPVRAAERALAEAQQGTDPQAVSDAQDALDEARAVQLSRRTELGEIRESSYRSAQGIERAYADAAAARLFGTLRQAPGVVHPEWEAAVGDLQAAKAMLKSATTQADKDAAKQLRDEALVRVNDVTRQYQKAGGDYVSLPDTRALGMLRGAVVQRDVAHTLTGFTQKNLYTKLLRSWKEIKTVFNFGTHQANIISNISFAHMEGLHLWEQPAYLKRAASDMRAYGPATKALTEAGILDVNAVNAGEGGGVAVRDMHRREGLEALLATTRPETADVLRKEGITEEARDRRVRRSRVKGALAGAALGAAKLYDSENPEDAALGAAAGALAGGLIAGRNATRARRLYSNEDNIFRAAIWLKKVKDGMTPDDATRYTREALGNFRSRSPALQVARSTVAPFILYPAKALPRFAKQVIDHPWRYATLIALWGGLHEYSKAKVGAVNPSDIRLADRQSSHFLPGFTQLPMTNARGERGAVDMARWTPLSALTTAAPPGSVPASFDEQTPDIFRAGGPVVDLAAKFGANVDPFSGKPAYARDYPVKENVTRLLHDVSGTMLPSMFDFHQERIKEDINNRDYDKLKNDALGPLGVKPRFVRPGGNLMESRNVLENSLREMKQDIRRKMMANKNPDRTRTLMTQYFGRVQQALDNFRERVGVEPPPDIVRDALDPNKP